MINYEPKVRREVARELARIINNADPILLDDIAINLNKEGQDNLTKALESAGVDYKVVDSCAGCDDGFIRKEVIHQLGKDLEENPAEFLAAIK